MADTPDIRARVVADIEQFVSECHRMVSESKKAGQGASEGFLGFSKGLAGVKELLGAAGIAVGVTEVVQGIRQLLTSSSELSHELAKSKEVLGDAGSKTLQLALAAHVSETEIGTLKTGITTLSKNTAEFVKGGGAAATTLRDLGFNAKDFKGKQLADQFLEVGLRVVSVADAQTRLNAASEIFGKRAGASLIPLFIELSHQSAETRKALDEMFSADAIAAVQRLREETALLKELIQGGALQFEAGLAEPLAQALAEMQGELTSNVSIWRQWGSSVGNVIAHMLISFEDFADRVSTRTRQVSLQLQAAKLLVSSIGDERSKAEAEFNRSRDLRAQADQLEDDLAKRRKQRDVVSARLDAGPIAGPAAPSPGQLATVDAEAARLQLELLKAEADARLTIAKALAKAEQEETDRAFAHSLESLKQHFALRRALLADQYQAERDALLKRIALAEKDPDAQKGKVEATKARGDLAALEIANREEAKRLTQDEIDAREKDRLEELSFLNKESEARGDDHSVRLRNMAEELKKFDELQLRERAVAIGPLTEAEQQAAARARADLADSLKSIDQIATARKDLDAATSAADLERQRVQDRIDAGVTSRVVGEREILQLEREQIPELQRLADILSEKALASGNPDKLAEANAAQQAVERLRLQTATNGQRLGATLEDAAAQGIHDFATKGIQDFTNLEDAARNSLLGILQALDDFLSQIAAKGIVNFLAGLFSSGISPGAFKPGGSGAGVDPAGIFHAEGGVVRAQRLARGGRVRGPGTGTSDSIPARLPAGSFVVRAREALKPRNRKVLDGLTAGGGPTYGSLVNLYISNGEHWVDPSIVRQPGVLPLLEHMNAGHVTDEILESAIRGSYTPEPIPYERYALGGLVDGPDAGGAAPGAGASRAPGRVDVHVLAEFGGELEGRILGTMASPAGQRIHVQTARKNRRALGS